MVTALKEIDYRDMFENAVEGIFQATHDDRLITANAAFAHMLGFQSPEKLIKERPNLSRHHFVDPARHQEYQRLLANDGLVKGFEYEAYRKDGNTIWISNSARARKDQNGALLYEGIVRDVTANKQEVRELIDLLARERAVRHEAEIFRDANIALTQDLSLNTVLETLLEYLRRLVPYDSANVMLRGSDAQFIVTALRYYEDYQKVETTRAIVFDGNANSLLRRLYLTQQSVLVPDTHIEPAWEWKPGAEHVRNWLGVPLVAGGKVIGLYSMDKVEPGFFMPEHARLAETLAARAASAIQNAQLFEQSQHYVRRLIEAQEEERQRIARELHDQIGQVLTALRINLHAVQDICNTPEATSYIEDNISIIDEALRQVRDLSIDLRPPLLDDIGLVTALRWYVERQAKRAGLRAEVVIELPDQNVRFARELETACFRIAQEAMTNVVRHARAKRVLLSLQKKRRELILLITDDGVGFDVTSLRARAPRASTLGLIGMQERAHAVGADIEITSARSKGTQVRATFTLKAKHQHS
jgi:PAS domain S-box-containing protein